MFLRFGIRDSSEASCSGGAHSFTLEDTMDRRAFLKTLPLLGVAPAAGIILLEPPKIERTYGIVYMGGVGNQHTLQIFVQMFNEHNPEVRLVYTPYPALVEADPELRKEMLDVAHHAGFIPSGTIGWLRP